MQCSCGATLLQPYGNIRSQVAVMSDFPSIQDLAIGRAYSGDDGKAFIIELEMAGIPAHQIALLQMYPHPMQGSGCVEDWEIYASQVLFSKKVVLFLGEAARVFVPPSEREIFGISIISKRLRGTTIICGPSLSTILTSPNTEMRFACERFAEEVRSNGLI